MPCYYLGFILYSGESPEVRSVSTEAAWALGPFSAVFAPDKSPGQQNRKKPQETKNNRCMQQLGQIMNKIRKDQNPTAMIPGYSTTKELGDHLSHPSGPSTPTLTLFKGPAEWVGRGGFESEPRKTVTCFHSLSPNKALLKFLFWTLFNFY